MSSTCMCWYTSTWATPLVYRPGCLSCNASSKSCPLPFDGGRDTKIEGSQVERKDTDKGVWGNNDRIARLKSSLRLDCS